MSSIQMQQLPQLVYNHVAMHHSVLRFLQKDIRIGLRQDIGVDAEIVHSMMGRWESEGRLMKDRCCPDCLALYQFSDREFDGIKTMINGQELEGPSIIDGSLMAMLDGEWVTLPMPERVYKPLDLPHRGYRTPGQGVIEPGDIDRRRSQCPIFGNGVVSG